ncbi:MAG TPA: hypothetical protein VHS97_04330, partial [Isosphaeraceae bacterium]|nr:hypothetical protein [Isosphaeraceae bacterium]
KSRTMELINLRPGRAEFNRASPTTQPIAIPRSAVHVVRPSFKLFRGGPIHRTPRKHVNISRTPASNVSQIQAASRFRARWGSKPVWQAEGHASLRQP